MSKTSWYHWFGSNQIMFTLWLLSAILFFFFFHSLYRLSYWSSTIDVFYLLRESSWLSGDDKIKQKYSHPRCYGEIYVLPQKVRRPRCRPGAGGSGEGTRSWLRKLVHAFFFFLISFLFINIHIQECAHFSAAGHDKGKRFQWWILVCVCKFHACEVGLIARQTEVLLFLHKQLQSRERQCERPSLARPRGMTGGTSSPVSGLSSEG